MRISLCMITRDEERNLERCLTSVRDCVDEICILDTGSRDRTVEIARRVGARVHSLPWRDDFSAARNAALELATGDWVLVLDADEALPSRWARDRLEAFGAEHPGCAGQVTIRDQDIAGNATSEVHSIVTRFFPLENKPAYEGCIHEQVLFAGAPPKRAHTGLDVLHFGYSQEAFAKKKKRQRNVQMLRAEITMRPECAYLWYQLGLTYAMSKEHEPALKALTGALAFVAPDAPYIAHLTEMLCATMREMGYYQQALDLISDLHPSFPDRADTVFQLGLLSMENGHLERAEECFRTCLSLAGTRPRGGAYAPSASTTAAAHNLAVLHTVRDRHDQARHYYRMALAFDSKHTPSLVNLRQLT